MKKMKVGDCSRPLVKDGAAAVNKFFAENEGSDLSRFQHKRGMRALIAEVVGGTPEYQDKVRKRLFLEAVRDTAEELKKNRSGRRRKTA